MGARFFPYVHYQPHGVPFRVWAGARIAALVFGICVLYFLWQLKPSQIALEPPVIEGVAAAQLEAAIPKPAIETRPPLPQPNQAQKPLPDQTQPSLRVPLPQITDRPTPQIREAPPLSVQRPRSKAQEPYAAQPSPEAGTSSSPRLATAPGTQGGGGGPNSTGASAPRLGGNTLALLRARECARLDIRDRPADCPPNEELARLLAQERGPQYRPENADSFSRNELAWRGVPPPCLDNGENAAIKGGKLCVRFGNTPSRVRSPREICEARGLGGCEDTPGQAAVNAAVEQVRAQQSAKQGTP
jgi:hypothetical protein